MVHAAHVDFHNAFADLDFGDVLLGAGIHAAGDQFVHFLTAAEGLHTGVMDHFYDIATVGADIKFHVFHIDFLR
jgi:hypothetical protein